MRSKTRIAIPPGSTIKECLSDRLMTQKEFSLRMDMSEKHISKLMNGSVQLTSDMAFRLEMVLGVPAEYWMNLEAIYRKKLQFIEEENLMAEEKNILDQIPYHEMAKLGWVENTRDWKERILNLRKYFEIVSLKKLDDHLFSEIAFRKMSYTKKSEYSSMAWAQKVKLESRKVETNEVDVTLLNECLNEIRSMTILRPEEFYLRLKDLLSECGIALVLLPHLSGSSVHGATFNMKKKIVLGLTVRGKDADKFWFSLFHELGHIVYRLMGISCSDEHDADEFARNMLIPVDEYREFIEKNRFAESDIRHFADRIGIDPGIVVGRLQKDKYIRFNQLNDLKKQYELLI